LLGAVAEEACGSEYATTDAEKPAKLDLSCTEMVPSSASSENDVAIFGTGAREERRRERGHCARTFPSNREGNAI
jgi:hypothetical protein